VDASAGRAHTVNVSLLAEHLQHLVWQGLQHSLGAVANEYRLTERLSVKHVKAKIFLHKSDPLSRACSTLLGQLQTSTDLQNA
jgi:hypothetical protein